MPKSKSARSKGRPKNASFKIQDLQASGEKAGKLSGGHKHKHHTINVQPPIALLGRH